MSLKDKSEENKDLAYALCDMEHYNAAANRFYYSCYQKLYQLAVDKMQYKVQYKAKKKKGSHEALIEHVDETINLLLMDQKKALKLMRTKNIKGVYYNLKSYRVRADYKDDNISKADVEDMKKKIEEFEDYFNIIKETI
ncbi:hypothetical protein NGB24_07170 [Mammaliicoccus vitulinus]|uniref:hypothetical protein n=1 Tax=Mammaliicoccus vitulinus TaxID=71237 RepID=UPI002DBBF57E|nr:hypothetical protein [Mammaliicoccus vitulinus]MEB7657633.1 hypothetical protein [Mammaliicoccus vitulinus]